MVMPRMSPARAAASSGSAATLTPPALPRPPALTCALTMTRPPMAAAASAPPAPSRPRDRLVRGRRTSRTAPWLGARTDPRRPPRLVTSVPGNATGQPIGSAGAGPGDVGNEVADERTIAVWSVSTAWLMRSRRNALPSPRRRHQPSRYHPSLPRTRPDWARRASGAVALAVDVVDGRRTSRPCSAWRTARSTCWSTCSSRRRNSRTAAGGVGRRGAGCAGHVGRSTSGLGQFRPPRSPTRGRPG